MYGIILFFLNNPTPFPHTEPGNNRPMTVFGTLPEADKAAENIEKANSMIQARVISIESVHE